MTCGVFSVDKGHQETREDVLIYCTSYPYFLQKCKCLLRLSWNTSPYMKLLKCNHAKLYAQAINWKGLFARNASIRVYHGHFEIDNKSRLCPNKEMYGRVELEWNWKVSACKETKQLKQNKTKPWGGSASVPFNLHRTFVLEYKVIESVPIIQNAQTVLHAHSLLLVYKLAVFCTAPPSAKFLLHSPNSLDWYYTVKSLLEYLC